MEIIKIDRISELPDHIIEDILSRLLTRDAVRTSLLSHKWRHKWTTTPSIVFDDTFLSYPPMLVSVIDHVLSRHVGPIRKFKLYHSWSLSLANSDIDRLILGLPRRHIQELSLTFYTRSKLYPLPSCVFSFQNLSKLELSDCWLRPPATFKGFKKLKILDLTNVTLAPEVLQSLICTSPVLEWADLWVEYIDDFIKNVNVDKPNLKCLKYLGRCIDRLAVVYIFWTTFDRLKALGITHMPEFFDHPLQVRRLTLV